MLTFGVPEDPRRRTMGQPGRRAGVSQWHLIAHARHGDMVIRVWPGMPLGESPTGELSFQSSRAQLQLDIAHDGALVLSAADDHELASTVNANRPYQRLELNRPAEIRLPHNVLRLVTDFLYPEPAGETVEVRAAQPTLANAEPRAEELPESQQLDEPLGEPVGESFGESFDEHVSEYVDEPCNEPAESIPPEARAIATERPSRPNRDEGTIRAVSSEWDADRREAPRLGVLDRSLAALSRLDYRLIVLVGIGFLLLSAVFRERSPPPEPSAAGSSPAPHTAATQAPSRVTANTASREAVSPSREPLFPGDDAPRATGGVRERPELEAGEAGEQSSEHERTPPPTDEPGWLPPLEPSSIPRVTQESGGQTQPGADANEGPRGAVAGAAKPDVTSDQESGRAAERATQVPVERRSPQAGPSSVRADVATSSKTTGRPRSTNNNASKP